MLVLTIMMVMMVNMMMMGKDTSDTIALAVNHLSIGKSGDCSLSPERDILSSFQNLFYFPKNLASCCKLQHSDLAGISVPEEGDEDVKEAELPVHWVAEFGRVVDQDICLDVRFVRNWMILI